MLRILIICLLFQASLVMASSPKNFRCVASGMSSGVIKVDVEKGLLCYTGVFNGTFPINYECNANYPAISILRTTKGKANFNGKDYAFVEYAAIIGREFMVVRMHDPEFPSEDFGGHAARHADYMASSMIYPTTFLGHEPNGNFGIGDFYCFSENIYIQD
ncbi:hypothetical protein ACFL6Y_03340 [Elusimicrobiota bacterium]